MKDIVVLNREDVDSFWKLRFDLLKELGEICSDINLIELEQSTKTFFLSSINKNLIENMPYAPLAQLDRALVYGTKGWGFELLKVHQTKNSNHKLLFFVITFLRLFSFAISNAF